MLQNNEIKLLEKRLKLRYWCSLFIILLVLGFMEYDEYTHPEKQTAGVQVDNVTYLIEVCYDLLSLAGIWFALKMMKMDFAQRRIKADVKAYYQLACYRETIMFLVVFVGILLHYLTYCPSTLWCSLIGAIGTLFVWPTKSRWESETTFDEPTQTPAGKV